MGTHSGATEKRTTSRLTGLRAGAGRASAAGEPRGFHTRV